MSEHIKTGEQIMNYLYLPAWEVEIKRKEQWVSLAWLKKIIEDGMNSYKDTDADLSSLLSHIELEEGG